MIISRRQLFLGAAASLAHHYLFVDAMINAVGPERLVFGTDLYSMMPDPQSSVVLDHLATNKLSHEHKAAILGGNLRRILQL